MNRKDDLYVENQLWTNKSTYKKTFGYALKVIRDLEILSRMDVLSKQILYCVHLLGIKRRNLESGNDYSFGKPYEDYKRALLGYGLSMESLIAYAD